MCEKKKQKWKCQKSFANNTVSNTAKAKEKSKGTQDSGRPRLRARGSRRGERGERGARGARLSSRSQQDPEIAPPGPRTHGQCAKEGTYAAWAPAWAGGEDRGLVGGLVSGLVSAWLRWLHSSKASRHPSSR